MVTASAVRQHILTDLEQKLKTVAEYAFENQSIEVSLLVWLQALHSTIYFQRSRCAHVKERVNKAMLTFC